MEFDRVLCVLMNSLLLWTVGYLFKWGYLGRYLYYSDAFEEDKTILVK